MRRSSNEIVHLNVGGTIFSTTRTTLTSPLATPSMLSAMLHNERCLPSQRDECGRLFIDRDGERFRVLLNYLRNGTVHVVDGFVLCGENGRRVSLSELAEEATFFGLESLREIIAEEIDRISLEEQLVAASGRLKVADAPKLPPDDSCAQFGSPTCVTDTERRNDAVVDADADADARVRDCREDLFTLDAEF